MGHQSKSPTHITDLPDELLAIIFRSLKDYSDHARCSLVCRRWLLVDAQSRQRLFINWDNDMMSVVQALVSRFDSVTRLVIKFNKSALFTGNSSMILTLISLKCRNLETFKIINNSVHTLNEGLAALSRNTRLKKFSCRSCAFSIAGFNALLSHSSALEKISVKDHRYMGYMISTDLVSTDHLVFPGAAESSLRCISVKNIDSPKTPMFFAPLIWGSKNLRSLKLALCLGNWDQVLNYMVECRENVSLCEVYLDMVIVSDAGLSALCKCPKLEIFHLVRNWSCTNPGIESVVKHCKSLTKIHIDKWRTQWEWGGQEDFLVSIGKHNVELQVVKYQKNVPILWIHCWMENQMSTDYFRHIVSQLR